MKIKILIIFILGAISCRFLFSQTTNHVVISEFATQSLSSAIDEFVELYNPTEAEINLNGWRLQYKPATGTTWSDKAILPDTANISAHGFYLIANMAYIGPVRPDYVSNLWTSTSGIANNGHLRIVNADLVVIDKVGYGSGNDPEGLPAPNHGLANNESVERKAFSSSTAESLAVGGLHYLEGNGYDSDNNANDFIRQTYGRNPQNSQSFPEPAFGVGGNGTGTVTVEPNRVFNNQRNSLKFTLTGDPNYIITQVKMLIPQSWSWSGDISLVELSGPGFASANAVVNNDTIFINSATVSNVNSGILKVHDLISPSIKTTSTFRFWTGVEGGIPAQILRQPTVKVYAIVPIVTVHVNNDQGVPAPPYQIGAEVTVTGTVTANLSSVQTNVYIQDETAGINIFSYNRPIDFQLGDSVILIGSIYQFRGLTEIIPDFSTVSIVARGCKLPEPMILTCADVNNTFQPDYTEPNESRLIRINAVSYNPIDGTITDESGTTGIFIPVTYPPTPDRFDVIGILQQYKPGQSPAPPYRENYQIRPRFPQDIISHPGPVITRAPSEDNIGATSVRISWMTNVPATSIVFYDTATIYQDSVISLTPTTNHSVWLNNLVPAKIYNYAVASDDANGRTTVGNLMFSTASPPGSTGQINVYFTKSVDTTLFVYEKALGNQNLLNRLLHRINNAKRSIDACFYNLSAEPGLEIATALINAQNRGVKVRVICEQSNRNNAPFEMLYTNGVPLISDMFDILNGGNGLMHNKFVIIDFYGGAPESVWVWTGSWNPSAPGTYNDRQNAIEIQDVALAGTFTREFEEMWGSSTQIPNAAITRFGARKRNNTPKKFSINGIPVECYFSPSDRTTFRIGRELARAERSISAALYSFTRQDLADSLIKQKQRGKKVRVIMDNNMDTGNRYSYLLNAGVDVLLKGFTDGLLHHKYALIDAAPLSGVQSVITGSHNWSSSAENANDENTLIIKDNRIANLYLQEFAARYHEAGGRDPIILEAKDTVVTKPKDFALDQNYPNPFNPSTVIRYQIPFSPNGALSYKVVLKVYNILGEEVAVLVDEMKEPGVYTVVWSALDQPTGIYFYRLRASISRSSTFMDTKKMLLLK